MTDALIPVEEKTVLFYGDRLLAARVEEDGQLVTYVPVKQISDNLGLDWSGQYKRLQRDPVLSEVARLIVVTPINPERGGRPDALCLPLKFLPGWLFGVNANRVRDELRDGILRYQREVYDVLYEAFAEGRLTGDRGFEQMLAQAPEDMVQAYQQAQAIVQLIRGQIILESRLSRYGDVLDDHEARIEYIEAELGNEDRYISKTQATDISQAVKAIAMELGRRTRRNEFGAVWGEVYRQFSVPSYHQLPARKYRDVMNFLADWWESISDDSVPF